MSATNEQSELPQAVIRPEKRLSWFWLAPILAALFAGWLGYRALAMRGVVITVQLERGYGLEPGAEVRYRGIAVGQIRDIQLSEDLDGVLITAGLHSQARQLARAGARFWVVRPQLGVSGVAGLETVVGPRYLAMLPGDGKRQRHFLGLREPPVVETIAPGDLEILLQAEKRAGLRPGAPVLYRQVPIGTILSVGLSSDAGAVEARVHIEKAYRQLVRRATRFWSVGGIEASLGLRGVSVEMESVEALLAGGVSMATPKNAGDVVHTGHRFVLENEAPDDWVQWEPLVMIGSPLLPPGSAMPSPMRAVIGWKQGRWIKYNKSRRGWVLQTRRGLLGPSDLLQAAKKESVVLEVAGRPLPLSPTPAWADNGLALLKANVKKTAWPEAQQRAATEPEDCLAIADPAAASLPLSARRLSLRDKSWHIDPMMSVDETWHGAAVVARNDGMLIGMILVEESGARVALLPKR